MADTIPAGWRTAFRRHGEQHSDLMAGTFLGRPGTLFAMIPERLGL